MKKVMVLVFLVLMLAGTASAATFRLKVGKYEVKYATPEATEVVNNVGAELPHGGGPVISHEFDGDIDALNSEKSVQAVLKELDYRRIGVKDTDTGRSYTVLVNDEGIIGSVLEGRHMPEVTLEGSVSKVRRDISRGDIEQLKRDVDIPFRVKMKLLVMQIV